MSIICCSNYFSCHTGHDVSQLAIGKNQVGNFQSRSPISKNFSALAQLFRMTHIRALVVVRALALNLHTTARNRIPLDLYNSDTQVHVSSLTHTMITVMNHYMHTNISVIFMADMLRNQITCLISDKAGRMLIHILCYSRVLYNFQCNWYYRVAKFLAIATAHQTVELCLLLYIWNFRLFWLLLPTKGHF